jgi:hypothetical protein
MKKSLIIAAFALVATFVSSAVNAQSTSWYDQTTNTGFAAKGDVQLALGLNNKGYQTAKLEFRVNSEVKTTATWLCFNPNSGNENSSSDAITTKINGTITAEARDKKNQITGHYITRNEGDVISSVTTGSIANAGTCNGNSTFVENSLNEVTTTSAKITVNGESITNL